MPFKGSKNSPERGSDMARKVKKMSNKRYFDYSLLFVIIFIVGFGLVMIYSTSSYTAQMEYGSSEYYFKKQLIFDVLGFIMMYIMYRLDYHVLRKIAPAFFALSLLLILALIPFGKTANGATRWIRFGPIGVQPADVSKTAVIIMLSAAVCAAGSKIKRLWYNFFLFVLIAGLEAILIMVISSNMSSALIILAIAFVMIFVAYPKYKFFVVLAGLGAGGVAALYNWLLGIAHQGMTENFRMNRLLMWIQPENYSSGIGYQTVQGLYAIGSGGLFGKGLGKSLQKLGFIPESQNDMIFSIICEELGVFGGIFVLILFGYLLYRLFFIAQNAPDLFGSLIVTGIFIHIALQVILNIAVVLNLMPNTGVTLPFISYGGTSIVFLMSEMAIALSVARQIKFQE